MEFVNTGIWNYVRYVMLADVLLGMEEPIPTSAKDCKTVPQLKAWYKKQHAQPEYISKGWRMMPADRLEGEYKTNPAPVRAEDVAAESATEVDHDGWTCHDYEVGQSKEERGEALALQAHCRRARALGADRHGVARRDSADAAGP